jgi:cobalt-zinc-cadmium efflux system protein
MGHAHSHTNEKRVGWAALITGVFMFAEVAGGVIAGSLALLADAGHMLTDCVSLGLAWLAFRIARRPADWKRTYGFDRFQVLAAFVNGLMLYGIAIWIVVEAIGRFSEPIEVLGAPMLGVAAAGLVVNIVAFWILHGADRDNLNVRGAAIHVMGDMLGSAAAIVAAIVIMLTGWFAADPLLSIIVALVIVRSATFVVRDAAHILLEGAPQHLDSREIAADLKSHVKDVEDVHHIHAWSITPERPMVTLHARIQAASSPEVAAREIKARLAERFHIEHATVEIEFGACADQPAHAHQH